MLLFMFYLYSIILKDTAACLPVSAASGGRHDLLLAPPLCSARAHLPSVRAHFPCSGGASASPRGLSGSGDLPVLPSASQRARPSSSFPSRALTAQAAPPGSSPSSGVLPSRVCRVGKVAAASPAAVARFGRLASLGHDPREDGGHRQGVSCTDKKQIVKTNLPCRTSTGWALRLTIVSEMGSEV